MTNPTTIQVRRGTSVTATNNNPVLAAGEIGFETDSGKFKIGDGSTTWTSLAYATDLDTLPASVQGVAQAFSSHNLPTASAMPTAAGQALVSTSANSSAVAFTQTGTVDTTDAPQPLGTANPGTGANGAAASDHVHPMPTSSQLADSQGTLTNGQVWVWNAAAGMMEPGSIPQAPLWQTASNGEITLPRAHVDDSASTQQTPGSKVLHLTSFTALASRSIGHVNFGTGATSASGNSLTQVGVYSVNASTGALTLLGSSPSPGSALGSQSQASLALSSSVSLNAGSGYAVGVLQVGSTSASLCGAALSNCGETPALAQSLSNQSSLPASISSGLTSAGFAVYYFLTN